MKMQDVAPRQDPEDPTTILFWDDLAKQNRGPAVPAYQLEPGDDLAFEDYSIPTSDYTSKAFMELEMERLWPRSWLMACRENDVPTVGDYLEFEIAGHSILIVRDAIASVRAFHNACRHRGTAIAEGVGTTNCFVCPFHGWEYSLNGTLAQIPAHWDFSYLDQKQAGLRPVQVGTLDGWVYINMDLNAPPLREHLGPRIIRHLTHHPSERFWKSYHFGKVISANWKVMAEAFFETYHISRTHPTLVTSTGDVQARYDAYGYHHRLSTAGAVPSLLANLDVTDQEVVDSTFATRSRFSNAAIDPDQFTLPEGVTSRQYVSSVMREEFTARGIDLSTCADTCVIDSRLYLVFPNFMPFESPRTHQAYRFRPYRDDPNQCVYEIMTLTTIPPDEELPRDSPLHMLDADEKFEDYDDQMSGLGFFLDQDVSNAARIQQGLPGLERLNFAERQEKLCVNFHHNLREFMSLSHDASL